MGLTILSRPTLNLEFFKKVYKYIIIVCAGYI